MKKLNILKCYENLNSAISELSSWCKVVEGIEGDNAYFEALKSLNEVALTLKVLEDEKQKRDKKLISKILSDLPFVGKDKDALKKYLDSLFSESEPEKPYIRCPEFYVGYNGAKDILDGEEKAYTPKILEDIAYRMLEEDTQEFDETLYKITKRYACKN